jgi:hypothetical protein
MNEVFGHIGAIDTSFHKISDFTVEFFANLKPYSKSRLYVYQGPRGSCLMKKTWNKKSRVTIPIKKITIMSHTYLYLCNSSNNERMLVSDAEMYGIVIWLPVPNSVVIQ